MLKEALESSDFCQQQASRVQSFKEKRQGQVLENDELKTRLKELEAQLAESTVKYETEAAKKEKYKSELQYYLK